ncbi:MAG: hypothetical protein JXA69_09080, partial [Phycisphaerae bacterium]|nr:hypothetical protein [Phycisphaerae bacterium]
MMPSHFLACTLVLLAAPPSEPAPPVSPFRLDAMPNGYHVQAYDDCGVVGRQPHVRAEGMHVFPADHVNADEKARSVAWGTREITARYTDLEPTVEYVLAVTYANEGYNHRTQGLWAGAVALHEPYMLPKGSAARFLFRVPTSAVRNGTLALRFTLEDQVNVVVSVIELWAPKPSPQALHIENVCGLYADLTGRVVNLTYDGVETAGVHLGQEGDAQPIATTRTQPDGTFRFERALFEQRGRAQAFRVSATGGDQETSVTLPARDVFFEPVRYRPMATSVGGLETTEVLLDGTWRLQPAANEAVRAQPLDANDWRDFNVPGQWLQQGYDLPREQPVAVAHEFTVPAEWTDYRVVLRFDSIHAGTQYWLNGTLLGTSENLYTPVEWDVTDTIRVGKTNRLDLAMKVDTISEQLSYSSNYAFHNLGGIDRSVRLFALPPLHVRTMHIAPELDDAYRDAELKLDLTLTNTSATSQRDVAVAVGLFAPDGSPVEHGTPIVAFDSVSPGDRVVPVISKVTNPLHWSDEKPNLYRLVLELRQAGRPLERIERSIGFRTVEIRGRQLYVNGQRVKLAGACRHEIDPLTGRANTMQHAEADLRLLKQANLNYVRTSHYPPPREVLDAADRLGLYLEVEAPFCWVGQQWTLAHCHEVLVPTSAMIDYCHAHPSVAMWSLANESYFCEFFEVSKRLCNDLDPTRPTTFNNPDPNRVCEIANLHYPPMPYDNHVQSDSRPVLLGEYLFPVCHEQTDVAINPGLRELWAAGHADPRSDWGNACATSFENPPYLLPGALPGAWSHIYHSEAVIGGAIWAAFDEPFYLPGGKKAGYMWVHGPWGLIDAWRRPKPEWWLAKLMFSPVWVTTRQVAFTPGQSSIRVPVENRYAFT